jgi:hypothetical protein
MPRPQRDVGTDDVEASLVAVLGDEGSVDDNEVALDQTDGAACEERRSINKRNARSGECVGFAHR